MSGSNNILQTICAKRRADIKGLKRKLALESIAVGLKPSNRSLYQALRKPGAAFILECKKASPSKGLIRENFDLEEIIAAYSPYAAAISVLTEARFFQGSFDYLTWVRGRVHQPVLNKDFILEPYQVYLARYYGADAILLMLSVLDDDTYQHCAAVAEALNLDVLTEVSNLEEVQRAVAMNAKIIGINNRNLRDLTTDLATTETLVEHIPAQTVIISESGINGRADVERLQNKVDGFLVGSSLMADSDLAFAVRQLVGAELISKAQLVAPA